VQTAVPQEDIPIATSLVMFFQQLSGSIFIAVAQSVLQNILVPQMLDIDSLITGKQISEAGATGLKGLVPVDRLPELLIAYAKTLNAVFRIGTVMAALGVAMACFVEWKSVKGGGVNGGNEGVNVERDGSIEV
jgi:hypothetical protein